MAKTLRALLPLIILAACGWYGWWLITHKPELKAMETRPVLVTVEGITLKKTSYPVRVASQGAVQPRTRSTLLPEVAGMITEVSPSFRPGGFFEKDEVLIKLDPVDYETAVMTAKAAVALAKVTLVEEEAKAEQALENWKALGRQGAPGELVSRSPQVARAKADLAAAEARVVKAERDAQRTVIRAPYAGQVLEQAVDVGQYVGQGTTVGPHLCHGLRRSAPAAAGTRKPACATAGTLSRRQLRAASGEGEAAHDRRRQERDLGRPPRAGGERAG
jgi:multidrug efflux system membrane fusion protein